MFSNNEFLIQEIFKTCREAIQDSQFSLQAPKIAEKKANFEILEIEFKNYKNLTKKFQPLSQGIKALKEINLDNVKRKISKKFEWNEEMKKLLVHYAKRWKHDWKKVTNKMKRITNRNFNQSSLKARYFAILSGNDQNKLIPFTNLEDALLFDAFEKYGLDWAKISVEVGGRSAVSVKNRYYYLKKRSQNALNK